MATPARVAVHRNVGDAGPPCLTRPKATARAERLSSSFPSAHGQTRVAWLTEAIDPKRPTPSQGLPCAATQPWRGPSRKCVRLITRKAAASTLKLPILQVIGVRRGIIGVFSTVVTPQSLGAPILPREVQGETLAAGVAQVGSRPADRLRPPFLGVRTATAQGDITSRLAAPTKVPRIAPP